MDLKQRLKRQLEFSRGMTDQLLAAFTTPEQWTYQPHESANHALWFVGHMGTSDNSFVKLIDPSLNVEKDSYNDLFGMGSQPTNKPADYPPVEEVIAFMRERRAALLDALDALSEDDLAQPTPEGAADFMPDLASVFETTAWHEGLHSGQLSVARRGLGNAPLFSPPSADITVPTQ